MAELLTPEVIARLGSLELRARAIADSLLAGRHQGRRTGVSSDFAEHRNYAPGDDVRHIDWRIFGKRDRFTVRQFDRESALQVWLMVDATGSMHYHSKHQPLSKLEYAATISAALSWLVQQQGDQVGLLTFTDNEVHTLPPRGNSVQLPALLHELERVCAAETLQQAAEVPSRTGQMRGWEQIDPHLTTIAPWSLVLLLTDAFCEPTPLLDILRRLRFQHCEVRLAHVIDPAEQTFPFTESMIFRDLEGAPDLPVVSPSIASAYAEEFVRFQSELADETRRQQCRYVFATTDRPLPEIAAELC